MTIRYLGHSAFALEHDGRTAAVEHAGIAQVAVLSPGEEHSP